MLRWGEEEGNYENSASNNLLLTGRTDIWLTTNFISRFVIFNVWNFRRSYHFAGTINEQYRRCKDLRYSRGLVKGFESKMKNCFFGFINFYLFHLKFFLSNVWQCGLMKFFKFLFLKNAELYFHLMKYRYTYW